MIQVKAKGLSELLEALNNAADNLPKEVYTALGAASTKVKRSIAQEVTAEVNVAQKVVRKQIKVRKDRQNLKVTCALVSSWRIPLRDFKARQTKKGVSARLNKNEGVTHYPGAFIVKKFGNHAYTRPKTGERGPILKMKGVSPFGVLKINIARRNRVTDSATEAVKEELSERIRFLNLKKKGGLNWQQESNENEES